MHVGEIIHNSNVAYMYVEADDSCENEIRTSKPINKIVSCHVETRPPQAKLQVLLYDDLPPASAITGYGTGLGKLSANGQFFRWCTK